MQNYKNRYIPVRIKAKKQPEKLICAGDIKRKPEGLLKNISPHAREYKPSTRSSQRIDIKGYEQCWQNKSGVE